MGRINFKIHPLFFVYVFLCIYFSWYNDIFFYVCAVVLHEFGHYVVAKYLGYNVEGITLSLYGSGMKSNSKYKISDDIIISLSGPFINVILILLTMCIWWVFPTSYSITYNFAICNIVVMLFNLLPIYPLDGGRIIIAILERKIKNRKKIIKSSQKICTCVGVVFLLLFIVSLFYAFNINLLFIGLFLTINGMSTDKNQYNTNIKVYNKKYDDPVEVKIFKVDNIEKIKLIKYLSSDYYSIFEISDNGKNIIIGEDELFNNKY